MQPFGILDFLKAFLPKDTPENASVFTQTGESAGNMAEKDSSPPPSPLPAEPTISPNSAAYQAFLDRHEKAAKKVRKN